jgi:hypothetical protein
VRVSDSMQAWHDSALTSTGHTLLSVGGDENQDCNACEDRHQRNSQRQPRDSKAAGDSPTSSAGTPPPLPRVPGEQPLALVPAGEPTTNSGGGGSGAPASVLEHTTRLPQPAHNAHESPNFFAERSWWTECSPEAFPEQVRPRPRRAAAGLIGAVQYHAATSCCCVSISCRASAAATRPMCDSRSVSVT